MLNHPIFMYVSEVYLEVIPAGSSVGDYQSLLFPITAEGMDYGFYCRVGQMTGTPPNEQDFHELLEIYIDELPYETETIGVDVSLDARKMLLVEVNARKGAERLPLQVFGPFQVN